MFVNYVCFICLFVVCFLNMFAQIPPLAAAAPFVSSVLLVALDLRKNVSSTCADSQIRAQQNHQDSFLNLPTGIYRCWSICEKQSEENKFGSN